MEDHREREGTLKGEKSEREMNHERSWIPGEKMKVSEGKGEGVWGSRLMSIEEGMCCDEHWVLYATNESLNTTQKLICPI